LPFAAHWQGARNPRRHASSRWQATKFCARSSCVCVCARARAFRCRCVSVSQHNTNNTHTHLHTHTQARTEMWTWPSAPRGLHQGRWGVKWKAKRKQRPRFWGFIFVFGITEGGLRGRFNGLGQQHAAKVHCLTPRARVEFVKPSCPFRLRRVAKRRKKKTERRAGAGSI
jgi:hypothetical protein